MANSGAARINQLVQMAKATFKLSTHEPGFTEHMEKLKKFVSTITAEDFRITPSLAEKQWDYLHYVSNSPSACMEVYECPQFSLGIFLIKPNKSMPLHDHPGMHGVMKVLFGSMSVTSYSKPTENGDTVSSSKMFMTQLVSRQTLTVDSPPCCLHPHEGNIHEIKATNEPVAFLDILAPPYNPAEGRDCTYFYRESSSDTASDDDGSIFLRPGSNPSWFSCVPLTYNGPRISNCDD